MWDVITHPCPDIKQSLPKLPLMFLHGCNYPCPNINIGLANPFNSLWPNDAIWWQRSGSTLVQVMACWLTAPSHYLNQCWLIISKIQLPSSDGNFTRDTSVINDWNQHESYSSKMSLKSPRANELSNSVLGREANKQHMWATHPIASAVLLGETGLMLNELLHN